MRGILSVLEDNRLSVFDKGGIPIGAAEKLKLPDVEEKSSLPGNGITATAKRASNISLPQLE